MPTFIEKSSQKCAFQSATNLQPICNPGTPICNRSATHLQPKSTNRQIAKHAKNNHRKNNMTHPQKPFLLFFVFFVSSRLCGKGLSSGFSTRNPRHFDVLYSANVTAPGVGRRTQPPSRVPL
jgi:hypothetical protein